MKKLVYFLLPLIIVVSFLFQSFKRIDGEDRVNKVKLFHLIEGVTIKMIWVEPGTFLMGSSNDELGRSSERETQHEVVLSKGYWLAETEITQQKWEKIMNYNPSLNIGGNLPVDQVSYIEIQEFLTKINRKSGTFRLPTEAEWEYACRAGSTSAYATSPIDEMVWHIGNSGRQSHPVAQKMANAWGFYDMQGNILEWCSDWFQEDNTKDNFDPKGPESGVFKIQRGGQFTGRTKHTRAADRQREVPDSKDFFVGFRLAHDELKN
ncbi:hypothetical protein A9Q87_08915 [Flavobacteriales bacterium 34_180_T64]|nr:hypothetical protein A9Q87_08915 [Flavobacteriales bacterium 34_180_T64]